VKAGFKVKHRRTLIPKEKPIILQGFFQESSLAAAGHKGEVYQPTLRYEGRVLVDHQPQHLQKTISGCDPTTLPAFPKS
jgi:hypothetical protein